MVADGQKLPSCCSSNMIDPDETLDDPVDETVGAGDKTLDETPPPRELDSGTVHDPSLAAAHRDPAAALIGHRIGSCRIVSVVASGGMGTVYEAEQDSPSRRVALKVLRGSRLSPVARRRFDYEAEILAHLSHPGIAQVYEVGTYAFEGEEMPYFVMELVADARNVLEYVRDEDLPLRDRLELCARVAATVHYGHQRGIVLRDLKPGNILVDREGHAKVIDFGIARADHADLDSGGTLTLTGQIVGTPQYMSPEQCSGNPLDIDSRTDVYSLGVVMYEILCGKLPYDLDDCAVPEMILRVREMPPRRPGTLHAELRGDVETILCKALAKEPGARYASAAGLAAALRRYLDGDPILARPASVGYQLKLFARRHRGLVIGTAIAAAALVAATILSTAFAIRAHDAAESEATRAENEKAARERAERLFAVGDTLGGYHGSSLARPREATAAYRQAIRIDERRLELAPGDRESRQDQIIHRQRIVEVLVELGEIAAADAEIARARRLVDGLLRDFPTEPKPSRLAIEVRLLEADKLIRSGDSSGAEAALRETIAFGESCAESFERGRPFVFDTAYAYAALGDFLQSRGDNEEAAAAYRTFDEGVTRMLAATEDGKFSASIARTVASQKIRVGDAHWHLGDAERALAAFEVSRDIDRRLMARDPSDRLAEAHYAISCERVGDAYEALGRIDDAIAEYRRVVEIRAALIKALPESPERSWGYAIALRALGAALGKKGELREACDHVSAAADVRAGLADANPDNSTYGREVGVTYFELASLTVRLGGVDRFRDAKTLFERAAARLESLRDRGELSDADQAIPAAARQAAAACADAIAQWEALESESATE